MAIVNKRLFIYLTPYSLFFEKALPTDQADPRNEEEQHYIFRKNCDVLKFNYHIKKLSCVDVLHGQSPGEVKILNCKGQSPGNSLSGYQYINNGKRLLVIGGTTTDNNYSNSKNWCYAFHTANQEWEQLQSLEVNRALHKCIVTDDSNVFLIIGGLN